MKLREIRNRVVILNDTGEMMGEYLCDSLSEAQKLFAALIEESWNKDYHIELLDGKGTIIARWPIR